MKKTWKIILIVFSILIVVRLILPYVVKKYVNNTLDNLDGYSGHVKDIDLNLFRGAYVIKEVDIVKTEDSIPVPFLNIMRIDLSVHWKALLKGSLAGEVILDQPVINFATAIDPSTAEKVHQSGTGADWTKMLKNLMPLQINRFEIRKGKINYKDFSTKPQAGIYLNDLNLVATNLSNVNHSNEKLPSAITANATSVGGGKLHMDLAVNVMKEIPDFDVDMKFEDADMTAFNSFMQAYAKIDVEKGILSVYSEVAADSGIVEGYVKPVIEDLQIVDLEKEKDPFLQKIWESIVGGLTELFENHPHDQLATKTPIYGDLNKDVDAGVWPTLGGILKNAFIEAFSKKVDHSVNIKISERD
ncbi:DUF748 domain-containing protein [Maribellus comscasis]|nr:DUF748 domain-containing protein [Maribellus comscasis]